MSDNVQEGNGCQKKKKAWTSDPARALLKHEVKMGRIPLEAQSDADIERAFNHHPEIAKSDRGKFPARLKSIRNEVSKKKAAAQADKRSLDHDRGLYPKKAVDPVTGKVRWDGSPAQTLLKEDVANGKHLRLKPRALHDSRPEYKAFDLDTFRGHIYREKDRHKFSGYVKHMAKEKNPHAPEHELFGPFQSLDIDSEEE